MPIFPLALSCVVCAFLSYFLVRILISRAHQTGLIDRPNERSSHTIPTPRGGGVGFVLTFFVAASVLQLLQSKFSGAETAFGWWLFPGCGAIAILGFLDDRFSLRASRRLLVQVLSTVASLTVLFWQLPPNSDFTSATTLNIAGVAIAIFAFFWIVWLTNLYNFMDGIDGYAALEAVLVASVLAAITWHHGLPVASTLYLFFAAAVFGFLVLNWSPAKIFMGDAGSTFLGFFFAVFSVATNLHHKLPLETTIVLLGTFVVDSTYTLCVRVARGKKAHVAHRDHAYQHAVQSGWSHRQTVLVFSAITLLWLTPIAVLISNTEPHEWVSRFSWMTFAFLPLIYVQFHFRAGIERK